MVGRSLLAASCLGAFTHVPLWISAAAARWDEGMQRSECRTSASNFSSSSTRPCRALQLRSLGSTPSQEPSSRSVRYARDTLGFAFEGDIEMPSYMDFKTLLCQMDYFYTMFLQEGKPEDSFTDVKLEVLDWSFGGNEKDFPVVISFIANAADETGKVLDPQDMNEKLSSRGFFLKKYAQQAWPEGQNQFHNTDVVTIETDEWTKGQVQQADFKFSSVKCPERGNFFANISFGFFDGEESEPTQQEVHDLEELTRDFMGKVLQEELKTDNVDIEFAVVDWEYDANGTTIFPLNVSFQVRGFFDDGAEIPLNILKYHLGRRTADGGQLMQHYIKQAVWETPPQKQSAFYSVNKAQMESKIHFLTSQELKSTTIFSDALIEDDDSSDPEDLPIDLTEATASPTASPTSAPTDAPTTSPAAAPSSAANPASAGFPTAPSTGGRLGGDVDLGNPSDTTADDSGDTSGIGPSMNIPGAGAGMPPPNADGDTTTADRPGSGPNDRPGGSSTPLGPQGQFGSLIPGAVLRPDQNDEYMCERILAQVDANEDKHLNKEEFVEFINKLTLTSFPSYPFEALPSQIKNAYNALATTDGPAGGYIMSTSAFHSENPIDELVQDAIRKNIICRAVHQAIGEAEAEEPTRGPAILAPATVEFMASCQGDDCGVTNNARLLQASNNTSSSNGVATLQQAFRNYLETDIQPIFDVQHKGEGGQNVSSYMAPESANITALDSIDCPRHEGDPGNDNVKCFVATGAFKVLCEGDDLQHCQGIIDEAEGMALQGIGAGLLKESLDLMSLKGTESPWQVYRNLDVTLSMHPSSSPTDRPSLVPTTAPTLLRQARGNLPTMAPTNKRIPTERPTAMPSEAPSSVPSSAPSQREATFWENALFIDGAGLGLAAGASIAAMIALQFFRELLVDIAIKIIKCLFCWRSDPVDDDESEDEQSNGDHDKEGTENDEDRGGEGAEEEDEEEEDESGSGEDKEPGIARV